MTSSSNSISEDCEIVRSQLQALQRKLPTLLNQLEQPMSTTIATHYNQVMFHLQAAREELREIQKESQTPEGRT